MLNEQPTTKQTNEMQQANSDGDDEGQIIYLLMVVVAVSSRGLRHHYRHRYVWAEMNEVLLVYVKWKQEC